MFPETDVTDVTRYVRGFDELGIGDVPVAGGKGAGLGELTRAGVRVPPGCVVTTGAYHRVMEAVDPHGRLRRGIAELDAGDPSAVVTATARVREQIATAPLPADVEAAILAGYARIGTGTGGGAGHPVAVRSSATGEDGHRASFAGLQDTFLWVHGAEAVLDQVRRCWAGLFSAESVGYRLQRGIAEDGVAMAGVLQRMVDARRSGVMFTRSPISGDRSVVVVEASWGLGSAVVGGRVTPDNWVLGKASGEVIRAAIATKVRRHRVDPVVGAVVDEEVPAPLREVPALSEAELQALVEVGRVVEAHYGVPQDIEWAIADGPTDAPADDSTDDSTDTMSPGPALFLLQSRPVTARSGDPAGTYGGKNAFARDAGSASRRRPGQM